MTKWIVTMFAALSSLCGVTSAQPKGTTTATPNDALQRRLEIVRQQEAERAAAPTRQEVTDLQTETDKLRAALGTLAAVLQREGRWSGPTDGGAIALMSNEELTRALDLTKGGRPTPAEVIVPTANFSASLVATAPADGSTASVGSPSDFNLRNDGPSDVRSMRGEVVLRDPDGNTIRRCSIALEQAIAAGDSLRLSATQVRVEPASVGANANRSPIVRPTEIVFEDGSTWRAAGDR